MHLLTSQLAVATIDEQTSRISVGDIAGSLATRKPGLASSAQVPISRSSHLLTSDGTTVSALAIAHWHTPFAGPA